MSLCRRISVNHLHGPSLCCMQHHTSQACLIHPTSGQKRQIAVGEKRKQLAELAPNLPQTCPKLAASSQPPPAESMFPRWQNSGTFSSFSSLTITSFTVLRYWAHLKSGSGCKGPLMPLHFLCAQHKQPPQKI